MKRLLLFLCTLLCANVLLAQTTFWVGDLQYEVTSTNPAEVEVNSATSAITTANIPETVTYQETTYDVTAIGDSAFYDCRSLTTVTIPNSVTYIGDRAFKSCSSLTSVSIPNSVTSIGGAAFSGCSSLTSVTIGNSVTSIGDDAFNSCSSLTTVTIPNSITSIGYYAFAFCSALTSVTIPNSVTSIGDRAFYGCDSLTSMTIEMYYIPNLSNIGLNSTLQNLTLGENVTSIRSGAFNNYFFLQNVTCLATTPPTLADNTVFPYPNIATLTVPCGSLEAYSAPTSFWNMFFAGRIEEDCSGLEDAEFAELSVYPNPTRGKVTFNQAIEKIEVIDLSGKTLQTYENANEINIETLPAGVYHLRMTIEDKTMTRKIIKE